MVIRLPRPANVGVAIQRCGYARFRDPRTGQESYTRRLGSGFYPRFHLYVEERSNEVVLSLHLDQKQPSYGAGHAHSGEYEGEMIETEARRLTSLLGSGNALS
jgi:hypothetical protein